MLSDGAFRSTNPTTFIIRDTRRRICRSCLVSVVCGSLVTFSFGGRREGMERRAHRSNRGAFTPSILMHMATRCMMSVEDVARRETLEQADQGADRRSVVAALGSILHWNVARNWLVRVPPLCRWERVVDPGLHQARQFCQCGHRHSGWWLVRGASFRALTRIPAGSHCSWPIRRPPVASARFDLPPVHVLDDLCCAKAPN